MSKKNSLIHSFTHSLNQLFSRWFTRPLVDGLIVVASVFLAYLLRFNFDIPASEIAEIPIVLAIMVVVRVALFLAFRAYTGTDRHPGLAGGFRLVFILISGSFFFILIDFITYYFINQRLFIPLTIIILEFLITTSLILLFRSLTEGGYDSLLRSLKPASPVTGTEPVTDAGKSVADSFAPGRLSRIGSFFQGKRVLITGAGGTTGTELTRQLLAFRPASLLLTDPSEKALSALRCYLQNVQQVPVSLSLTDITDKAGLMALLERYRPQVIIHCALYHDASLLETNPREADRVNAGGTKRLMEISTRYGTGCFVLVSPYREIPGNDVVNTLMLKAEEAVKQMINNRMVAGDEQPANEMPLSSTLAAVVIRRPASRSEGLSLPVFCTLVLEAAATGRNGDVFLTLLREPTRKLDQAKRMILESGLQLSDDDDLRNTDSAASPGPNPATARHLLEPTLMRIPAPDAH